MDKNSEHNNGAISTDAMKRKKDSFTLDFSSGSKKARTLDPLRDGILSSPDVGLLKLATPEIERFIIHQSASLTPTQILFPSAVTEEQEAYARGFVDALMELQRKQNLSPVITSRVLSPLASPRGLVCLDSSGAPYVALTPVMSHLPVAMSPIRTVKPSPLLVSPILSRQGALDLASPLRLLTSVPPFTLSSPLNADTPSLRQTACESSKQHESPPTVTEMLTKTTGPLSKTSKKPVEFHKSCESVGSAASVLPINMKNQEEIKLERKREKNRTAAQRCRYKKLERIARLEARVAELKNQNADLAARAVTEKQVVNQLRQQIVNHVQNGCQIMVVNRDN